MKSVLLLPTYNRCDLFKNFLKSYIETKSIIPALCLVDKNDPQKEQYLQIEFPETWTLVLTNERTMGGKIVEVWDQYKDCDAIALANDDHHLETLHWDQKMFGRLNGRNVLGTNDNWMAPKRLCGMTMWSGALLRAVGYLYPPGLKHLFIDSVWECLATKAGCGEIMMDVMCEHRHGYKDPKSQDATFLEVNGPNGLTNGHGTGGFWIEDKATFEKWLTTEAPIALAKVMALQPKTGLMVATPSHSGDCALDYALGLTDLSIFLTQNQIYFEMARVVGSSLIPHARNSLVDLFLQSRCQKMLFMDSDQGYTKEAVMHLFQSDKKIIAGVVPHKRFPINLNFEPLEKDKFFFKDLSNKGVDEFKVFAQARCSVQGEVEVNRVGTGFLMIDRSVFELMKDKVEDYQAFDNNPNITHKEFFLMGALNKKYRGEDWRWCQLAKDLGIPIYINANSTATHRGAYTFDIGRPI
jgi:hypothetical protein